MLKVLGLLLLPAGWLIALCAVVLLKTLPQQAAFVLAGLAIEAVGLTVVVRSHLLRRGDEE